MLSQIIPDPDDVLAFEPEELATFLLEHLTAVAADSATRLNRHNFFLADRFKTYPAHRVKEVQRAWIEAWSWLEREGMIAPVPDGNPQDVFLTRRALALKGRDQIEAYRKAALLPRGLLHPVLTQRIWPVFIRGEYDTAVFVAFKEIEVAVRDAIGADASEIGTGLMRRAFDASSGTLSDPTAPMAEREALAHLFAGAVGSYKNPASHRHVAICQDECVEMIILASHLLRIVEGRRKR